MTDSTGLILDIHHLTQSEFAALSVWTSTEIQLMIVDELIHHHANHLFPFLCKQVDDTIWESFATVLLQKTKAVRQELNTPVVRAVESTIKDD